MSSNFLRTGLRVAVALAMTVMVSVVAVSAFMGSGATVQEDVSIADQPVATDTGVEIESDSAYSALMSGTVVGRRGGTFGRRVPTSEFIP